MIDRHPQPLIRLTLISLLEQRAPDQSVCPSEVAREAFPDDWREYMDEVRTAALELEQQRLVVITQQGEPAGKPLKGPIRIQRGPGFTLDRS